MGKHMELILRDEVDNLGGRGDIVKVKAGYGRNFLLPRKLAVPLTEGNKKVVEQQRLALAKRDAKDKADAETLAAALGQVTLSFTRKAGEAGALFGSVTSIDLAEALAQKGFTQPALDLLEQGLKTAFHISFIFNRFQLGDDFCRDTLGFTDEQMRTPGFNMLEALGFTKEIGRAHV